ncbi:LysE family transporter, partial [uncultured Parasutterella sp.]
MFSTIFTIAAVHLIALMSPGPDCFIVMQTAVGRSRKEALCCVLGITLGVAFWAALSLLGLQWLFERFAWLQQVIMLLGGLYLGWLAYLLLKSAFKKGTAPQAEVQTAGSGMRSFIVGLLTNLSNAKALIYFSSVFSLFVTGDMGSTEAGVIYAVVVLESLLWFSFVALILGMPKPKTFYR